MTDEIPGLPGRPRVPREDLDPELVARAKKLMRARETRDRWARWDREQAEAEQERRDTYRGGNR